MPHIICRSMFITKQYTMSTTTKTKTNVVNSFLAYSDALFNFGLKLTRNEQDAEDLLQETYFKAIKYKNYFKEGTNVKAWLFRIMQNTFINNYRKASKIPKEFDVYSVYLGNSHAHQMQSSMLNEGLSDVLGAAVNALPDHYKVVLILCDIEGFKYKEIASVMDIPIGTVKTYIHKARQEVKGKLLKAQAAEYRMSA